MKNPVKVLFCHQTGALGGGAISMFQIIENLGKAQKIKPLILFSGAGTAVQKAIDEGYNVIVENTSNISSTVHVPLSFGMLINFFLNIISSIKKIIKIIEKEEIDIVYINSSSGFSIALSAWIKKKKIIWHIREVLNTSSLLGKVIIKGIEKYSNVIIVNSHYTASVFKKNKKIKVVYNGVDLENFNQFKKEKNRLRKKLKIEPKMKLVGVFAVLAPGKGLKSLMSSMVTVLEEFSNVRLLIVGDTSIPEGYKFTIKARIRQFIGAQYHTINDYKEYAEKLGISKFLYFTGWRNDVNELMNTLDILILPSKYPEGFGRSLIEAGACGIPVIASRLGAASEIVIDGDNGILYDPTDSLALSNSMISLLTNDLNRRNMGEKNYQRVKKLFLKKDYSNNIIKIIKSQI